MAYSSESSSQIYAEATWLQGAIVGAMFYGVVVVMSFMCWRLLWPRIRSHSTGYRKNIFFFCYVTFLFVLGTMDAAFSAEETQKTFIYNRLYPGGPSAFARISFSPPLGISLLLSNWCADLLMIWRCVVVYRDTRLHYIILGLGSLMFLTSVVTGVLWFVIMSNPHKATNGWVSIRFLFPYICVALTINIFISLLTVLRLLYHRRKMSKIFGPGHGAVYASFATIIIESAAICSISSLLYLIPFVAHNPLANAFVQILGQPQRIASLLIIYRVAEGKAWGKRCNSTTLDNGSSLQMRQMSETLPTSAAPNQLHIETHFDGESSRDGSIRQPNSRYSRESTSEADAPAGCAYESRKQNA
ncbi:uncharacterized protein EDB91DRAFT_1174341 [Suillus paluster]|uniref:uncharacterized protein n=1 Tax=Suillus paluster TaxID=48578 RepID=UPI001B871749|nr:uncharacterized protein EDB91DRAFT_1174341 [Suillus paluster]KAG1722694.1 hypothetical protein EDB91DRAFT_1174341 [Suillus paluster]